MILRVVVSTAVSFVVVVVVVAVAIDYELFNSTESIFGF